MRKIDRFPAARRRCVHPAGQEQPGLEKVSDLVVDMGNALENESRKKAAEDEDKNRS
jgi:hypothetical protein